MNLIWRIELSERVRKAFRKDLDAEIVRRIRAKLREVARLEDPTAAAKPMRGNLKGLWSYRIGGNFRVIVDVQNDRMVILAVEAGPRGSVYGD